MADEMKTFQPHDYYSNFLKNGFRPDHRKLQAFDSTSIDVGCLENANGSAVVHVGKTQVLCGIKAQLAEPKAENPNHGFAIPNVDLSPLCSIKFVPGPPSEMAQVYSQLMVDLLANSALIDLESLCLVNGKLCWCLYIDISCLNYGGNVLDACVLAMVCALRNTHLPDVVFENDKVAMGNGLHRLKTHGFLVSSTFAFVDGNIIADPTSREEAIALGLVSVFMKDNYSLCNIFMHRGCKMEELDLKRCIKLCKARCKKLTAVMGNLD